MNFPLFTFDKLKTTFIPLIFFLMKLLYNEEY